MDHSNHFISGTAEHSMPGDHTMPGGHDMPMKCSMNMLFTWDYQNTCIIFSWWHITSLFSFIFSILIVVSLSVFYEYCRYSFNKWEKSQLPQFNGLNLQLNSYKIFRLKKACFYGFQIGYSFMLMLVFMTYNGWLMLAVVAGGIIGNRIWDTDLVSLNCH